MAVAAIDSEELMLDFSTRRRARARIEIRAVVVRGRCF